MKKCSSCKALKPIEDYYFAYDRPQSRCKPCFKADTGSRMKRRYYGKDNEHIKRSNKLYKQRHPEKYRLYKDSYSARYPDKLRAGQALRTAVYKGKILKPDACDNCTKVSALLHGHHYLGYAEANYLDVLWLCPQCHSNAHKTNKP